MIIYPVPNASIATEILEIYLSDINTDGIKLLY